MSKYELLPELKCISKSAVVRGRGYPVQPATLECMRLVDASNTSIQTVFDLSDWEQAIQDIAYGVLSFRSVVRITLRYRIKVKFPYTHVFMNDKSDLPIASIDKSGTVMVSINLPAIPDKLRPKIPPPLPEVAARALVGGQTEAIKRLFQTGFRVNIICLKSPLALATKLPSTSMLRLLLGCDGVRVNMIDSSGDSPLQAAVINCNPDAVRLLLEAKADATTPATRYLQKIPLLHRMSDIYQSPSMEKPLLEILDILLNIGTRHQVFEPNYNGLIPSQAWSLSDSPSSFVLRLKSTEDEVVAGLTSKLIEFISVKPLVLIILCYMFHGVRLESVQ